MNIALTPTTHKALECVAIFIVKKKALEERFAFVLDTAPCQHQPQSSKPCFQETVMWCRVKSASASKLIGFVLGPGPVQLERAPSFQADFCENSYLARQYFFQTQA